MVIYDTYYKTVLKVNWISFKFFQLSNKMVYKSPITRFFEYITSKKLRPMKKWSIRSRYDYSTIKSKCTKKIIKQIRKLLNFISGNDIIEMLKGNKVLIIKTYNI